MLKPTLDRQGIRLLLTAGVCLLALAGCTGKTAQDAKTQTSAPAGANLSGYWNRITPLSEYDAPPAGETGPILDRRGMEVMRAEGRYVLYLGDYNNPILQPWVAEKLKNHVETELKGSAFHEPTPQEICRPSGVPNVWTIPTPIQVVQTQDHVAILFQRDHQFRIARLNKEHPSNLKPSAYGDSVGHWEGDTLVVDTIGQNDKTPVDVYNTPHTDKIHVVERFRLVDGEKGDKNLQIHFTVEDPGAFTRPWSGVLNFRPGKDAAKRVPSPLMEEVCAENDRLPNGVYTIPTEGKYQYPD
jgi:hypothetical protein